jgi:hypothetical protein
MDRNLDDSGLKSEAPRGPCEYKGIRRAGGITCEAKDAPDSKLPGGFWTVN